MEKLTVSRFGEVKNISGISQKTGKPYSFYKVGFLSNEYPERWYDFTFNERNPLQVGNQYEFEVGTREYNGKTYYEAKLPKRPFGSGGMSEADRAIFNRKLDAIDTKLNKLTTIVTDFYGELVKAGQINLNGVPFPMKEDVAEVYGGPPVEAYENNH